MAFNFMIGAYIAGHDEANLEEFDKSR